MKVYICCADYSQQNESHTIIKKVFLKKDDAKEFVAKLKYKFLRVKKYLTKDDEESLKIFENFYRNIDSYFHDAEHAEYFVKPHDVIVFDKNLSYQLRKIKNIFD